MTLRLEGLRSLRAAVGTSLGRSDWITVDGAALKLFADATGTADLALLLLSLTNRLLPDVVTVEEVAMGVNYGVDEVRFARLPTLPADARLSVRLVAADDVPGGLQTTMLLTMEVDGQDEPACVVVSLSRWLE